MTTATRPAEAEPFFTIATLAEHWQVSRDTIRSMIARGELKAYRIGPRRIRIDPKDARKAIRPVTSLAAVRGGRVVA